MTTLMRGYHSLRLQIGVHGDLRSVRTPTLLVGNNALQMEQLGFPEACAIDAGEQDRHNLLHGGEAAVHRWAAAGADLVVGGHIHLPFVLPLRVRWPSLPRAVWAVQAGTAVTARVRADAGNSVNFIRTGAAAASTGNAGVAARFCVVERWDYMAASGNFERMSMHPLADPHTG